MFDRQDGERGDITATSTYDRAPGDSLTSTEPAPSPRRSHPLDGVDMTERHKMLLGHYARELDRQAPNRQRMAEDEDLYDHEHWTDAEKAELEARGQTALVYNVTFTSVNWVLGSHRRTPMDHKILPRRKEGTKHAERKSELLKWISDVNHAALNEHRAFAEVVKAGLSWLETGAQDPEDGTHVYERYESWRNIIADSTAQEWDFSDGRYIFRAKWVDLDRAIAMFPERRGTLEAAVENVYSYRAGSGGYGDDQMDSAEIENLGGSGFLNDAFYTPRRRVRLIEAWYRFPEKGKFVRGGDFSGEVFDPHSPGHQAEVESKRASLVDRTKERVMVALMTETGMLYHGPSPYRHNRYPFTPIWGYRRAKDGMPYGMIRGLREIQRSLNKRASKMLHHLSTNRVFYEEGSVEDPEVLRQEAARPDAMIAYKQGRARPDIITDYNIAQAHGDLMSRDIQMIEQTSGVTQENLGRETNAASGKAIIARQEQGELTTATFFENLRFARVTHGEKMLSNIEQFYTEEMQFRITNMRGNPEFVAINDDNPDDDNHIALTKADFVVAAEDFHETKRQADLSRLMEAVNALGATNPEFLMGIMDLLVEAMDVPKRDEIVRRIRQLTGQTDPDADPENPDPEMQAMQEQKAKQAQLAERDMMLSLALKEAQVAKEAGGASKLEAEIAKIFADINAGTTDAESAELDKLEKAVRTAAQMRGVEGVGVIADLLMTEAERRAAQAEQAAQPPAQPAPQPEPMPAEPQPQALPQPQGAY